MLNISVLVSGGGTNLQALIDGIEGGEIPGAQICRVISGNPEAYALQRAKKHGIPAKVIDKGSFPDKNERTGALLEALKEGKTDLIVLAGYMNVLPQKIVREYRDRIINIHPSLIPKYCGMGFYGKRVHQAVLDAGETVSGATVHLVDEGVDTGSVIIQKEVPVLPGDTADSLAGRVLATEHEILKEAVNRLVSQLSSGGI